MNRLPRTRRTTSVQRQKGAALYVALIFLVILALLGISGMQVALLQERMASNYRATNEAFQRAEGVARAIEGELNTTDPRFVPDASAREQQRRCDDPAPVRGSSWADLRSLDDDADTAVVVSRLDECTPGYSIAVRGAENEKTAVIWQISAFATDAPDSPTSDSAVETIFMP